MSLKMGQVTDDNLAEEAKRRMAFTLVRPRKASSQGIDVTEKAAFCQLMGRLACGCAENGVGGMPAPLALTGGASPRNGLQLEDKQALRHRIHVGTWILGGSKSSKCPTCLIPDPRGGKKSWFQALARRPASRATTWLKSSARVSGWPRASKRGEALRDFQMRLAVACVGVQLTVESHTEKLPSHSPGLESDSMNLVF